MVKNTKLLGYGLLGVFLLTLLRGIRYPNLWSYTHFVFNYDMGFIKRGFLGWVLTLFGNPFLYSYEFFTIFSVVVLAVNIVLLFFLMRDLLQARDIVLAGVAFLFASSMAVVSLAHVIGYLEQVGLLLTLVILRTRRFGVVAALAVFFLPLMLLIHETQLVLFFPLIFLSILLREAEPRKKAVVLGGITIVAFIVVLIVTGRVMTEEKTVEYQQHLEEKTSSSLRTTAFDVLYFDVEQNLEHTWHFWSMPVVWRQIANSLLVTLPLIILFVIFIREMTRKFHPLIRWLAPMAGLAPLLLYLVAWDFNRWNVMAILNCFIIIWMLKREVNSHTKLPKTDKLLFLMLLLFFLNGASSIPLFDDYRVKNFPFVEHQDYILDTIEGKNEKPFRPEF